MFGIKKIRRFVLIGLLSAGTPVAANETPLFLIGSGESVSTSNASHGFSFALSQTLTVTGLGKIDANGNGLLDDTSAAEVALWNTDTREQLVSVTLDDNIFLRENQFFASTNPTEIPPGNYTIGARYFVDQEPTLLFGSVAATPIEPQFDIVSGFTPKLGIGDGLSFPVVSRSRVSIGPTLLVDLPEVLITEPKTNRVNQRRPNGTGAVTVAGIFGNTIANSIEFRAVSSADPATDTTDWQAAEIVGNRFTGDIELPATGWYDVEIRSLDSGTIRFEHEVPNIGLGEVFVTAGQSNSANHGAPPLDATSGHVFAMDEGGFWHPANDPQPIATGSGGTPWPVFGDLLVEELEVPVGIVSVGWGGTEVGEWLPGAAGPSAVPLYDRLRNALDRLGHEGARAILWH